MPGRVWRETSTVGNMSCQYRGSLEGNCPLTRARARKRVPLAGQYGGRFSEQYGGRFSMTRIQFLNPGPPIILLRKCTYIECLDEEC
jgi:hypothetical protein